MMQFHSPHRQQILQNFVIFLLLRLGSMLSFVSTGHIHIPYIHIYIGISRGGRSSSGGSGVLVFSC